MSPSAFLTLLVRRVRTHAVLLLVIVILGGVAGVLRLTVHASLPTITGVQEDSYRTCSDVGTLFEGMQSASGVTALFNKTVSVVVAERQLYLSTPSMWSCIAEPPMAKLSLLASNLPGWYFPVDTATPSGTVTGYRSRVGSFSSFSSVLAEFLREYECKLSIMEDRTSEAILSGNDIDQPCTSSPCPSLSFPDFFIRPGKYKDRITADKDRARVALERTLHTMRSFEANYAAARNIWCFELASLDLRNELGLLADATSCMPKIWDAITSLHDRKY
jgi:hypothetical protein